MTDPLGSDPAAEDGAPRVPAWFRVKGLSTLPPGQQAELLDAARGDARESPPVALAALGALLGVISALWSWRISGDATALWLWAAVLPLITLVWVAAVRRALADAVRRRLRDAPAAGASPSRPGP